MEGRRRSKNRVVEAMAHLTDLAIGQEPARLNGDAGVDRVDSVAEGLNQALEPLVHRVSALRVAGANSLDGGFDLDEGGHREENGILMTLEPVSKGGSFRRSRRQALEQSGIDQPGVHALLPALIAEDPRPKILAILAGGRRMTRGGVASRSVAAYRLSAAS